MIKIKDWMSCKVQVVDKEDTVLAAAKLMDKFNIGSVVIVQKLKPIGILTERDMLRKIVAKHKDPARIKVKDIMTKKPKLVSQEASLLDVTRMMSKYEFRRLIITNETGNLCGIVTSKDLIKLVSA